MHVSKIPVFWPVNSSIRARSRSTRRRGNGSQQSLLRTFRAAHVRRRDSCSIGPGDWAVPWVCRFQIPCIGACAKSKDFPPADRGGWGICGPNKARRRPRRKVQRINVSTRPVRNAETIGIWLLSQSPWTLRARGAARDRRPGSGTATGRGKAAHYAIILLSSVWVSKTRLRGRPSSFDVVSLALKALHRPRARARAGPTSRDGALYRSRLSRSDHFIDHFKLYALPRTGDRVSTTEPEGRGAPPAPRRGPDEHPMSPHAPPEAAETERSTAANG
jgi:hypothetical protein